MKIVNDYLKEITMSDEDKVEVERNVGGCVIMKRGIHNELLVLLIQRAAEDHWPHHFEIPRGGCDDGEKVISCALREVKEETGLDVIPIKFIDKFSYIADQGTRKSTQYNFLCRMKDPDQPIKLSKEHQGFKWVQSVGEIELFVMPEIKKTISKVLNPSKQIVDYPENEMSEETIEELLNKNLGE